MEEIMCKFDTLFGLLNCCGANIDETHIIMALPAVETSDDWCDLEKNHCMFLQGIAVHEMRFLDIVKDWPGGLTFPRLLKCSGFFKLGQNAERLHGNSSILITRSGNQRLPCPLSMAGKVACGEVVIAVNGQLENPQRVYVET
ncbi:hypothetical protein OIU78_021850 [Salix suchowensis]|nr:hypothetical protein OIU78_021850 [Salix suchowensis]